MKRRSSGILTISSSPVPLKNTRDMSTYLQQAFPANHSALRESKKDKTTKEISGRKRSSAFAMFDPDTHSWRTSQVCLVLGTSAKSSLRWPKQGLMRDGVCSELTMSVPRTDVKGSGSRLPAKTPSAADAYTGNMKKDEFKFGNSGSLAQEVESGFLETHRMWPTPEANERNTYPRMTKTRKGVQKVEPNLAGAVKTERNSDGSPTGGQLNPNWVEWLIGWPIGWTDLKPLAMGKYQQWLQQHGRS